jgi:hypothetical protein
VLFVHGLEGHPNGAKVIALRDQGFEVIAPDMFMSLTQLGKRNSVVRQLLRLTEVRVAGLLTVVGLSLGLTLALRSLALGLGLGLTTLVLAAVWYVLRSKSLVARALGRSFAASVAIQTAAVREAVPDVVVGSSWGGAVAAELVVRGQWSGPTILLAPAIQAVWERSARGDVDAHNQCLRELADEVPILVFHDPSDATIAHADSVRLSEGSSIELRSVDAGGHRLMGLLEQGSLGEAIRAMVGDSTGSGSTGSG